MKNIILAVIFAFGFLQIQAQNQLDKAANKICEKLSNKDLSGIKDMETLTEELGAVMLEVVSNFSKKERKKLNIDVLDQNSMRSFGEKVGERMGATCEPFQNLITKLMAQDDSELLELVKEKEGIKSNKKFGDAEGIVVAVYESDFLSISIEDEDGNVNKYYLLKTFDGAQDFIEKLDTLKGREIEIGFVKYEVYNPTTKAFKKIKEIKSIVLK